MINELLCGINLPEYSPDYGSDDFVNNEFEVYYSLAKVLKPKSIIEVGVYKGYSACSMIYGALPYLTQYVGIDHQTYISNSNELARNYINKFWEMYISIESNLEIDILDIDTMTQDIPKSITSMTFTGAPIKWDWIHIDGAHEEGEAEIDINKFWPLVAPGKFMTIHDYEDIHPHVKHDVDKMVKLGMIHNLAGVLVINSGHNFVLLQKGE